MKNSLFTCLFLSLVTVSAHSQSIEEEIQAFTPNDIFYVTQGSCIKHDENTDMNPLVEGIQNFEIVLYLNNSLVAHDPKIDTKVIFYLSEERQAHLGARTSVEAECLDLYNHFFTQAPLSIKMDAHFDRAEGAKLGQYYMGGPMGIPFSGEVIADFIEKKKAVQTN